MKNNLTTKGDAPVWPQFPEVTAGSLPPLSLGNLEKTGFPQVSLPLHSCPPFCRWLTTGWQSAFLDFKLWSPPLMSPNLLGSENATRSSLCSEVVEMGTGTWPPHPALSTFPARGQRLFSGGVSGPRLFLPGPSWFQELVTTLAFHGATARPEVGDRGRWPQVTSCGRLQLWTHALGSGLALLWDSCPSVCPRELVS